MFRFLPSFIAVGLWVNLSEFIRNEWLLKTIWLAHYEPLGLVFPNTAVNGALWGLWGFLFAGCIIVLNSKLNGLEAFLLSWVMGFGLMWIALGNLAVLTFDLLPLALPLSLLEVGVALLIAKRLEPKCDERNG